MYSLHEKNNYNHLVRLAEKAFMEHKYLEAFLIQSCVIEGVLKNYANTSLAPILVNNPILRKKLKSFEIARLTDELFIGGRINKELYENLNKYRNKRNKVMHGILQYQNEKEFYKELVKAYKLGKDMKGFIVDEIIRTRKGKTIAALSAKIEYDLGQIISELPKAINREITPEINKIFQSIEKPTNKK